MLYQYTERDAARFWAKVDTSGCCWTWMSAKLRAGYGVFTVSMRRDDRPLAVTLKAHRVAWELTNGPIPPGMIVCHNCPGGDNPSCVRPDHLYVGTYVDNNRDTLRKGRWRSGSAMHPERMPRGDGHPNAVLDEQRAIEIKRLRAEGMLLREIAQHIGVSISTVHGVLQGRSWRHVEQT